jgi:hypothetical protein
MGKRQTELINVLCKGGFTFALKPKIKKEEVILSPYYNELLKVYKQLGGILDEIPNQYTRFDVITTEGIIELDEERHFNQYRNTTLNSMIYQNLNNFETEEYKSLCQTKETACLNASNYGRYWTTPSSEKQFGISNLEGNLMVPGSARWKQRAFYDFMKDSLNLIFPEIALVRISIYETIEGKTIHEILNKKILVYYPELANIIRIRIKCKGKTTKEMG